MTRASQPAHPHRDSVWEKHHHGSAHPRQPSWPGGVRQRVAAAAREGCENKVRSAAITAQHSTLSAAGTPRAPLAVKQTPSQQFPPRGAYPHAAAEGLPGRTKHSWRAPEQLGAGTGSALPSSTRAAARSPGDRDACRSRAESSGPGSRPPPRNGAGTAGTPRPHDPQKRLQRPAPNGPDRRPPPARIGRRPPRSSPPLPLP